MENETGYTVDYVRARIEDAGRTLMMIPNTGVWPKGHASTWPEIMREWEDMLGCNLDPDPARIRPTMKQMNDFAEVMDWIVLLAKYCRARSVTHVAKAVGYGMLHRADGSRFLSWRKLAVLLNTNHKRAQDWYNDGVEIITRTLNRKAGKDNAESVFGGRNQG